MKDLIQSADELKEYFLSFNVLSKYHFDKYIAKKVYVKSKIRCDWLASVDQGRLFIKGDFYDTIFENAGGGLWMASIEKVF